MCCRAILAPTMVAAAILVLVLVLGIGCAPAAGTAPIRRTDLQGRQHQPIPAADGETTLLLFVMTDCPIANAYAPEICAITLEWTARGVRCFIVQVDPQQTAEQLGRHAAEYGFNCPVLHDRDHALVRRCGVTHTPEAVVFTAGGALRYRGRIDDRFPALDVRRPKANKHELRDALTAIAAGVPIEVERTQAVGCPIRDLEPR